MVLDLDSSTGSLPPGIHEATWTEFEQAFATNAHRRALVDGLRRALDMLAAAGCRRVYVGGSFVTAKPEPGDFDACWDGHGVDPMLLEPRLFREREVRAAQKREFGGELFLASADAGPMGPRYLELLQLDRVDGRVRGIVALDPRQPNR